MRGVRLTTTVSSVVQGSLAIMAAVLMCVGETFGQAQQPPAAPPPPPAQISYFLDRPPTSGAAAPTDLGSLTSASLALCVTGLTSGRHTVWAVTVDSSGAPLTTPIESKVAFTVT